ncbi:MAG TPA: hypothetical protein VFJ72_11160 [Rubrobacteraceae bacterium]|nr:hypothetical protein [Rubrobacteraceae bacterium]
MRRRWAALLWTAVALQVVLVLLGILFEALDRPASSLGSGFAVDAVVGAASILAFPAVGALIFWRRPEHPIGWLFCVVNVGWAINHFAGPYAKYALAVNPGAVPGGKLAAWFYFWPGPVSVGLLILLFLLFPDGRLLSPRWRTVAWVTVGYVVVGATASAFAPGRIDDTIGFKVDNPAGIGGPIGHLLRPLAGIVQPLPVLLLVAALISLALRQRRSRGQERQQLKWFTSSLILYVVLVGADTVSFFYYGSESAMPGWASLFNDIAISSYGLIPIAAGIAILRYRLYEIDLLINRALVYSALTVSLAAVYVGSVVLLQMVLRSLTGESSQLAVVASTLAIAALFNPLRRRVQALVDRRFYRRKYDAARTLEAFGSRLRDETDLDDLSDHLVAVVRETMQPEHVSLWLRTRDGKR